VDRLTFDRTYYTLREEFDTTSATLVDLEGLSLPITIDELALGILLYRFEVHLSFSTLMSGESGYAGVAFSVTGPSASNVAYTYRCPLDDSNETVKNCVVYGQPDTASASTVWGVNVASIIGTLTPFEDGELQVVCACDGVNTLQVLPGSYMFVEGVNPYRWDT